MAMLEGPDVPEVGHPNRAARRAADRNGYGLPIIQLMLFPDGRVKVDSHKDVTNTQIREFLQQMLDKLPADD